MGLSKPALNTGMKPVSHSSCFLFKLTLECQFCFCIFEYHICKINPSNISTKNSAPTLKEVLSLFSFFRGGSGVWVRVLRTFLGNAPSFCKMLLDLKNAGVGWCNVIFNKIPITFRNLFSSLDL